MSFLSFPVLFPAFVHLDTAPRLRVVVLDHQCVEFPSFIACPCLNHTLALGLSPKASVQMAGEIPVFSCPALEFALLFPSTKTVGMLEEHLGNSRPTLGFAQPFYSIHSVLSFASSKEFITLSTPLSHPYYRARKFLISLLEKKCDLYNRTTETDSHNQETKPGCSPESNARIKMNSIRNVVGIYKCVCDAGPKLKKYRGKTKECVYIGRVVCVAGEGMDNRLAEEMHGETVGGKYRRPKVRDEVVNHLRDSSEQYRQECAG